MAETSDLAWDEPAGRARQRPRYAYFDGTPEEKALGLFSILAEDGSFEPADVAHLERRDAIQLYLGMLTNRITDARLMALQRQGRIGFYAEALGQEASVVGTAAALDADDWLVPALREAGAGLYRGLSLGAYIAQIFGNDADVCRGRQMPCHPCDRDTHYVVMSSCVANQIPQAVGIAMAMKIAGDRRVCMSYMGDGGTSEADFHVALNFAGVMSSPCVFVCQNNQWAISTPGTAQTASETFAIKGLGYGVESLRADGNDILAVHEVARYAVDKARRGGGPTFIELLTYRVSAHTSSDDPSRYRDETVTAVWRERRDPLARFRTFLIGRGWMTDEADKAAAAEIEQHVRDVIAEQETIGPPPPETLVQDVYEEVPWHLAEQLQDLLARLS
jgi:pyruvate dehydrogenase E1 component alpha subunit/2-oxoisovalerate dehydrogenase E1 component alpha subunit